MNTDAINTQARVLNFNADADYCLLNEYVDILSERYPMLSVTSIGQSVCGRRIPMLTVGKGKKCVLYIGGQAGNDGGSVSVLMRYVNELCEYEACGGRAYKCSIAYMLAARTVIVIPMLNPDGAEYRIHGIDSDNPMYEALLQRNTEISAWSGNARGVMLEENYGECFDDPRSFEPETGAVRNYLMFNRDIGLVISLNKGENSAVCSQTAVTPPRLNSIGRCLADFASCEYSRTERQGTLCGFCANELVIPAFEMYGKYSDGDIFGDYIRQRAALFLAPTLI